MVMQFIDEYSFLSNFYPSEVTFEGMTYKTVEHAYQAAKTLDMTERRLVQMESTPGRAKRAGREIAIRKTWESMKIPVMTDLIRQKFKNNNILCRLLVATEDEMLIEGNNWHDEFWGMDLKTRRGRNELGKILMQVRDEIRTIGEY